MAVIFAVLAGGELFGFLGVLLALPIASVAMVLLRYGHERYRASALYGEAAVIGADENDIVPEMDADMSRAEIAAAVAATPQQESAPAPPRSGA